MTTNAVVFDIGNVLIRWDPHGFYDRKIGIEKRKALFAEVPIEAMNVEIDRGAPFRASVSQLAKQYPTWADEIMMWHDNWADIARPAIDHSVRLLRALRRKGMPVFALSNFGNETFEVARNIFPFLDEFDARFISAHVGMMKPDLEFYQHLESETGLCGAQIFFTDDLPENIAAAASRGWQVHLFEGARGLADALVAQGLLTRDEAA